MMARKVCRVCLVEKDLDSFPPTIENSDGHLNLCRECKRIRDNQYSRRRNAKDHSKVTARNAAWAKENREQDLARKRRYNREHLGDFLLWCRKRRATNLDFKLKGILRCRLRLALNGQTKSARTMEMIGCSTEELRKHLEAKWSVGMSWDNYGGKTGWQIDHILPCASFNMSKSEDQRRCFHFTNLQPLWAGENRAKGTKVENAA